MSDAGNANGADARAHTDRMNERVAEIEAALAHLVECPGQLLHIAAVQWMAREEIEESREVYMEMLESTMRLLRRVAETDAEAIVLITPVLTLHDDAIELAKLSARYGAQKIKVRYAADRISGANARWENDPKTKEKQFVRSLWDEWQLHPERYASKATFSRDMLDKCEHLISSQQIERWCLKWENT